MSMIVHHKLGPCLARDVHHVQHSLWLFWTIKRHDLKFVLECVCPIGSYASIEKLLGSSQPFWAVRVDDLSLAERAARVDRHDTQSKIIQATASMIIPACAGGQHV